MEPVITSTQGVDSDAVERALMPMVVVVPTHGRPTLLGRTLDSVLACLPPEDRPVRMIVVENGAKSGAELLVAQRASWLRPEYMHVPTANKSAALNAVLETLGDCLMLFFDDDIRVDPQVLRCYSGAAADAVSGWFYGGGVLVDYEDAEEPPGWLLEYLPVSAQGWRPAAEAYRGVTDKLAFLGCNWAAFARDIKSAGGFDRRFGPGGTSGGTGQERAMQIALRERGVAPKYLYDAVVWHYVPRSRCSPRWALERTHRNAIRAGHELVFPGGTPRIAGVPVPLLRRAMQLGWAVTTHWFGDDAPTRHRRLDALMGTLGHIRGAREHHVATSR